MQHIKQFIHDYICNNRNIFLSNSDFDQILWASNVAAVVSCTCSTIGLGFGIGKVIVQELPINSCDHLKSRRPCSHSDLWSIELDFYHVIFTACLILVNLCTSSDYPDDIDC
ncbi:hypothetical protein AQUCO_05400039v1 [Aquilegia coerulea]|uniref:Uncharacterized protein n=1 Tax=Aquilegia coerulea TaxID=218851 RepID=A0A2G5CHD1_AQUCA|nr:hypothetical protein AQUCO_05400039v1 [Aquilegia coerulea]